MTVYPPNADGDVAPIRVLRDADMLSPQAVAIGPDDELFVSTCPKCGPAAGGRTAVFHFANGSTVSDFRIGGATNKNTGFTVPSSLAVRCDPLNPGIGATVVVGNSFGGNISVIGSITQGDQLPLRTLQPRTGANLQSLALAGNCLFLAIPGAVVDAYPADALSNAPPSATLTTTDLPVQYPSGIAVDASVLPPIGYLAD